MKKKKIIIAVLAVAIVAAGIVLGISVHKSNQNAAIQSQVTDTQKEDQKSEDGADEAKQEETKQEESNSSGKAQADSSEAQEEKTPVFMYFVSEQDDNYDEAVKVFEELKKEYAGKIEFDLKNVTQDPELLKNFSLVDGQTPALIMDGKEGIVGFEFKTTDKKALESNIEKALK